MERIEDFLTVDQVSVKMGFNQDTIRRWCLNKDIKSYKVGNKIRIYEADVVAFIKSGEAT